MSPHRLKHQEVSRIELTSDPACPCNSLRHCPLEKFHIRVVPSLAPVISRRPASSNAIAVIFDWWRSVKWKTISPLYISHTHTWADSSPLTT